MRALWLATALLVGCANLPDPVEPLARTPDAAFRQRAPERLPSAQPARLPPVRTERLANGLLLVVATRPNSPSTSVELVVRGAGSEAISEGSGMALATLFALVEAPEAMFTMNVDHEAARLGIDTDEAGLDTAVRELANAVQRPTINEPLIHATRSFLSKRIARERLGNLIQTIAYQRLYAEPPALLVAREVVAQGITAEAVLRQYQRFYGPEVAALIVAGPAPFERVRSLAVEHFGGWKPGSRSAPQSPTRLPLLVPSVGTRPIIALDLDGDMAHAILMLPGPPNGFPGFPEYLLADVLLGNSFSSRGNAALRLHDAKSYGVWSGLDRRQTGSELWVTFDVEQDDFVESLKRILSEVERLRRELVPEDELVVAKIAWQARLSSRLVTSSGTVALLGEGFALDGDPEVLGAIADGVARVRPADIQQVARREFTPDRMQVVVFASRQKLEAELRHVGPIGWQTFEPE